MKADIWWITVIAVTGCLLMSSLLVEAEDSSEGIGQHI